MQYCATIMHLVFIFQFLSLPSLSLSLHHRTRVNRSFTPKQRHGAQPDVCVLQFRLKKYKRTFARPRRWVGKAHVIVCVLYLHVIFIFPALRLPRGNVFFFYFLPPCPSSIGERNLCVRPFSSFSAY